MTLSVFDIFKVGIGPSSSHTVGPMRAARQFVADVISAGLLEQIDAVNVELFGSLGLTGKGHCTDRAVILGLAGHQPETVDVTEIDAIIERVDREHMLSLLGRHEIQFDPRIDVIFHKAEYLPRHSNGMRFSAFDADRNTLLSDEFYSVGGGFVIRSDQSESLATTARKGNPPHPFDTASDLLARGIETGLSIDRLMLENELTWRGESSIREGLLGIWQVMKACVNRGLETGGTLPGGLNVTRRAPLLFSRLRDKKQDGIDLLDWVDAWALAVNEENAAGGRVVTAPTNGAAGIVPAVLHYYMQFVDGADDDGVLRFLLTAGAIGMLFKHNASISGAEMGCQGEVGVACSMAAAGLASAQNATNAQIENAAEIGIEHNFGLTCDPVGGLVQIPCIERNAMGAVKAINATRIALHGDGSHKVSLDQAIATMRQTGLDMSSIYKETSQGGLAVNVVEC